MAEDDMNAEHQIWSGSFGASEDDKFGDDRLREECGVDVLQHPDHISRDALLRVTSPVEYFLLRVNGDAIQVRQRVPDRARLA